jgi:hypothetical protein
MNFFKRDVIECVVTRDLFTQKWNSRPLLLVIHITTSLLLQPAPTHPKLPYVIYIICLFQLLNVYPRTTLVSFEVRTSHLNILSTEKLSVALQFVTFVHLLPEKSLSLILLKYEILFSNLMLPNVWDVCSTSLFIWLSRVQFIGIICWIIFVKLSISVSRSRDLVNSNDVCIVYLESKIYIWSSCR